MSSSRTGTLGPGSQLDWEPGYPGKGVLLYNGDVHTWPFNGDPFEAMHYDVMAQRGVPANQIKNTLEIDVDGTVKVLSAELEPEDHEALQAAGLITQETGDWDFADWSLA